MFHLKLNMYCDQQWIYNKNSHDIHMQIVRRNSLAVKASP